MSFAVSLENPDLEWAGSSLATVFGAEAQPAAAASSGACWPTSCASTARATAWLRSAPGRPAQPARLPGRRALFGGRSRDWYLLPMAAAIWSCPTGQMLDYPARHLRALLPQPRPAAGLRPAACGARCKGGGREYVQQDCRRSSTTSAWPARYARVTARRRRPARYAMPAAASVSTRWCWPATATRRWPFSAARRRRRAARSCSSAIRYQPNRAVLHTDAALLPRDAQAVVGMELLRRQRRARRRSRSACPT